MIELKKKYESANKKAVNLMQKGLLKEYIAQLKEMSNLKKQMLLYAN